MIDCMDKQQTSGREPVFWPRDQPRPSAGQHHNHQTALTQSTTQSTVGQPKGQQRTSILVDVQPDQELAMDQSELGSGPNNDLIGYYFGSISRETAEWILINHGNQMDGAYLLRSSGPKDDFVLSLLLVQAPDRQLLVSQNNGAAYSTPALSLSSNGGQAHQRPAQQQLEVLHYKIVETGDSFVALHGQVGDEKFATIDELIERAQGVATKPKWPIQRHSLEMQILPPTFWGLSVDQVRLAILIKAKQWGFPLSIFQQPTALLSTTSQPDSSCSSSLLSENNTAQSHDDQQQQQQTSTTLNNETIRTLIYKSLHEFQPWFHGRIGRDEAERRLEDHLQRDGRFLVRERDNFSYAMCISHKRTIKHYRVDVLPTGELAIQDGRKFTSLMALVSHYTIMSDGLWCALTEPCPRPIQQQQPQPQPQAPLAGQLPASLLNKLAYKQTSAFNGPQPARQQHFQSQNIYCVPPTTAPKSQGQNSSSLSSSASSTSNRPSNALACPTHQNGAVSSLRAPIKEWLHSINNKWSQIIASKTNQQHQSLNSFLFGPANPLNNHCRHKSHHHHHHNSNHHHQHRRRSKANCTRHHQQQHNSSQTLQPRHSSANSKPNNIAHHNQQAITNANCHCCPARASGPPASLTQSAQSRMPAAGGMGESNSSLRSLPADGLILQYNNGLANGPDQLVPSNLVGQQHQPLAFSASQQSKVLLSCLPQNSGFMLDSQSFIGSPLFAVKTSAPQQQQQANGARQTPIDGLNGSIRRVNGLGGGGCGGGNNVEKLISPAQSIAAELNATQPRARHELQQQLLQQQHDANPYALHSDIYGSQTSTAIVNDHLQTSSSSSSSNHTKQLHHRPAQNHHPDYQQQHPAAGAAHTIQGGNLSRPAGHADPSQCRPAGSQQSAARLPPSRRANGNANVQHAGPILCGQHAGPAYRYANCTGLQDTGLMQCAHSAALGLSSANQSRAADDLHLLQATNNLQLAGPAALTKFVQFQDGQCLRTHRDTKSIQMAYLLSRQEALNVLNTRSQTARMAAKSQFAPGQPPSGPWQSSALAPSTPSNELVHSTAPVAQSSGGRHTNGPSSGQIEYDLIDCDGDGFQFKYDPKLIKSSSIETLCGIGDEDEQDDERHQLGEFKSNSELLMSLAPFWSTANNDGAGQVPLIPVATGGAVPSAAANQPTADQSTCPSSLLLDHADCKAEPARTDTTAESHFEENWNRKHNLDELTTALLAELTASLKAQVELKNKRSGLFGPNESEEMNCDSKLDFCQPNGTTASSNLNPLELVEEFDTLISHQTR